MTPLERMNLREMERACRAFDSLRVFLSEMETDSLRIPMSQCLCVFVLARIYKTSSPPLYNSKCVLLHIGFWSLHIRLQYCEIM